MKRGDIVTVAATGDYGKPRPAVIIQTDALPERHASVILCQMTSDLAEAPDLRVTIEPHAANGLRVRSQIMADKPSTPRWLSSWAFRIEPKPSRHPPPGSDSDGGARGDLNSGAGAGVPGAAGVRVRLG
jgi:mRNA interferase MazF